MQKSMRRGRALGRAAHLPLGTFRPPQAAALSVKIGNKAGGTEGREPSLHVDASRVHSPPPFPLRPRQAGPTLFPPISCPAVLWLLGQAGNIVLRDRGTGGSAALRGDYGGQRERSRITRAAIPPALSASYWSEGVEEAC